MSRKQFVYCRNWLVSHCCLSSKRHVPQGFDPELDVDDVYQGAALLTKRQRARITDVKDALGCFSNEWDADYDISEVEPGLIVKALTQRVAKMSCPYKAKLSFNYPYV